MKIIHCADIHADSKLASHFTREMAHKRREEIVDAFGRMVEFARRERVRVIIIAGDLFDTKASQQKSIKNRLFYIIAQNPQIDFLYLRGNHDEEFEVEDALPNLRLFCKEKWTSYAYDDVEIFGREFGASIPAGSYGELAPDAQKINIVVLHGQIAEYMAKDGAPVISLPKLTNQNIDYLALGHIHNYKKEKLDSRCSWCYSGCLEGRGFDECGQKGFVLLNISDKKIGAEFIPNSQRIIHQIEVPLSGAMSYNQILGAVEEKLFQIPYDDIVQVDLTGEISEETEIETDSYQNAFASKFFYIRFKDKTEPKIDYQKYENDVSLKGEFIRMVKAQELPEEEKSQIIMTGIKALAGRL